MLSISLLFNFLCFTVIFKTVTLAYICITFIMIISSFLYCLLYNLISNIACYYNIYILSMLHLYALELLLLWSLYYLLYSSNLYCFWWCHMTLNKLSFGCGLCNTYRLIRIKGRYIFHQNIYFVSFSEYHWLILLRLCNLCLFIITENLSKFFRKNFKRWFNHKNPKWNLKNYIRQL